MPTYRKLHTKALESQDIADMPDDFTRYTWLILPLVLSRDGTTIYQAHYLVSKLYPLRSDVSEAMVSSAFLWYEQRGMIRPYTAGGRRYLWVPTFAHYQGDTVRESASPFPAPPTTDDANEHAALMSNSRPAQEPSPTNSCPQGDAQVDTQVDAKGAQKAAPPLPAALVPVVKPKRQIDHSTVPLTEDLDLLYEAYQKALGYAPTDSLPVGVAKQALVKMFNDGRSASDIGGCTAWLASGSNGPPNLMRVCDLMQEWLKLGKPERMKSPGGNGHRRESHYDESELKALREADRGKEWSRPID